MTDDEKAKLRFELANANAQSIGRAQGIYVTVLLAYICLVWGVSFVGGNEVSFHLGPFDLKVDGVSGVTPLVLLFLTLVYIGSLTAAAPAFDRLREAEKELCGSHEHSLSEFDTHKNVIDYLAVLQLDPRWKTHAPTEDDKPSVVHRVPHLILPVLFMGSAFTSFWAVYESYRYSHYGALVFGGCCLLVQVAYSIRPVWRCIKRFLGAKRTSDVFH